jgi:hypothetical protein
MSIMYSQHTGDRDMLALCTQYGTDVQGLLLASTQYIAVHASIAHTGMTCAVVQSFIQHCLNCSHTVPVLLLSLPAR